MFCASRVKHVPDTPRGFVERAQHFGFLVLICVVIWAISGGGSFWPVWVIAFGGISLAKRAYRTYGRAALADADHL